MSYYTTENFKSKKALKEAVASGATVTVWSPGKSWFGHGGTSIEASKSGPVTIYLEGPHYPEPHKWYASAKILNGAIIQGSVK